MFNFNKKSTNINSPEYIIAGLGNPRSDYDETRHNIGFMSIDKIAVKLGIKVKKIKFKSLYELAEIGEKKVVLLKPSTFMNNSGEAIVAAANFYKISPENIIIICDDVNFEVGKIKIKRSGSDGGHNGLKNIIYLLNSDEFVRIKIGVGYNPFPPDRLADWVLSKFKDDELKTLDAKLDDVSSAVEYIVDGNIDKAMNEFNSKGK